MVRLAYATGIVATFCFYFLMKLIYSRFGGGLILKVVYTASLLKPFILGSFFERLVKCLLKRSFCPLVELTEGARSFHGNAGGSSFLIFK